MYLTQPGEPWKEMRPFLDDAYKRFITCGRVSVAGFESGRGHVTRNGADSQPGHRMCILPPQGTELATTSRAGNRH